MGSVKTCQIARGTPKEIKRKQKKGGVISSLDLRKVFPERDLDRAGLDAFSLDFDARGQPQSKRREGKIDNTLMQERSRMGAPKD